MSSAEQPLQTVDVSDSLVVRWRVRLEQYCSVVLFVWSGLTFSSASGILPGAVIWAIIHGAIVLLFSLEGSIVHCIGNILIIMALGYVLVAMAIKHGQVALFPQWGRHHQQQFMGICKDMALLETMAGSVCTTLKNTRKTNPKKFYLIGLAMAFVVGKFGGWIPTLYLYHLLASTLLLLPPALTYHWLHPSTLSRIPPLLAQTGDAVRVACVRMVTAMWRRIREVTVQRTNQIRR